MMTDDTGIPARLVPGENCRGEAFDIHLLRVRYWPQERVREWLRATVQKLQAPLAAEHDPQKRIDKAEYYLAHVAASDVTAKGKFDLEVPEVVGVEVVLISREIQLDPY